MEQDNKLPVRSAEIKNKNVILLNNIRPFPLSYRLLLNALR